MRKSHRITILSINYPGYILLIQIDYNQSKPTLSIIFHKRQNVIDFIYIIFRSKSANIKVYAWFKASYSQKLLRELLVCQHQVMMVTNCSAEQLCSITTFIQMHYSDAKVSSHFIKENAKPLPNTSRCPGPA